MSKLRDSILKDVHRGELADSLYRAISIRDKPLINYILRRMPPLQANMILALSSIVTDNEQILGEYFGGRFRGRFDASFMTTLSLMDIDLPIFDELMSLGRVLDEIDPGVYSLEPPLVAAMRLESRPLLEKLAEDPVNIQIAYAYAGREDNIDLLSELLRRFPPNEDQNFLGHAAYAASISQAPDIGEYIEKVREFASDVTKFIEGNPDATHQQIIDYMLDISDDEIKPLIESIEDPESSIWYERRDEEEDPYESELLIAVEERAILGSPARLKYLTLIYGDEGLKETISSGYLLERVPKKTLNYMIEQGFINNRNVDSIVQNLRNRGHAVVAKEISDKVK